MVERITIDDIIKAGHCPSGARTWFNAHSLDFRDFLKNGVEAEVLLATGDGLAQRVVDRKREREARADG